MDLLLIFLILLPSHLLMAAFYVGIDGWAVLVIMGVICLWLRLPPFRFKRRPRFPAFMPVIRGATLVGVAANFLTLGITRDIYAFAYSCAFFCLGYRGETGPRVLHGFPWSWWPTGVVDGWDLVPVPARFIGNVLVYGLLAVGVQLIALMIWRRVKAAAAPAEPPVSAEVAALWGLSGPPSGLRERLEAVGILAVVVAAATLVGVPPLWVLHQLLPISR